MLLQSLLPLRRLILASLSLVLLSSVATAEDPLRIYVMKHLVNTDPLQWSGDVVGDTKGSLTTTLLESRLDKNNTILVKFLFEIDAEPHSMDIELEGILNTQLNRVVMNGKVVNGDFAGAQVDELGQGGQTPKTQTSYRGIIQVMPRTANFVTKK